MPGGRALLLACAAAVCGAAPAGAQPLVPTPIGVGAEFQPPARWPLAGAAVFGGFRADAGAGARIHLELFADRKVVVVPGGIGVSGGRTELYGRVADALWHAPAWTTAPGGVIHLERPGMRLADVFAVWGQPLAPGRLLTFRGRVETFVNGRRFSGPPGDVVLHDRDQVVVQIGGFLPPHASFVFPPRTW
jgi:hypothetical protein